MWHDREVGQASHTEPSHTPWVEATTAERLHGICGILLAAVEDFRTVGEAWIILSGCFDNRVGWLAVHQAQIGCNARDGTPAALRRLNRQTGGCWRECLEPLQGLV